MTMRTSADVDADVRRYVTRCIARNRDIDPELTAIEIDRIYTGHYELRALQARPEYCPNHPSIRNPCGLCPPPAPPGDDDDD